jgi:hypothetical protein
VLPEEAVSCFPRLCRLSLFYSGPDFLTLCLSENRSGSFNGAMRGLQAIALSLLAGFFHSLTPFAFGQSEYSEAKIRAYWNKHVWKGALQYTKAWTQGEPNNATAWFHYGTVLNIEFQDSSDALNAMLKGREHQTTRVARPE